MANVVCARCYSVGTPKTVTPGSIFIEIVLWLLLIIPGVIYSVWRLTARKKVCRSCGSDEIVPVTTPRGKELLEHVRQEAGQASNG